MVFVLFFQGIWIKPLWYPDTKYENNLGSQPRPLSLTRTCPQGIGSGRVKVHRLVALILPLTFPIELEAQIRRRCGEP